MDGERCVAGDEFLMDGGETLVVGRVPLDGTVELDPLKPAVEGVADDRTRVVVAGVDRPECSRFDVGRGEAVPPVGRGLVQPLGGPGRWAYGKKTNPSVRSRARETTVAASSSGTVHSLSARNQP